MGKEEMKFCRVWGDSESTEITPKYESRHSINIDGSTTSKFKRNASGYMGNLRRNDHKFDSSVGNITINQLWMSISLTINHGVL
jgi:hypothetical protein